MLKVFVVNCRSASSLLGAAALCRAFREEDTALSVTDELYLLDSLDRLVEETGNRELKLFFPFFRDDGQSRIWLQQALSGEGYQTVLVAEARATHATLFQGMSLIGVRDPQALMLASSADSLGNGRVEDQFAEVAKRIVSCPSITEEAKPMEFCQLRMDFVEWSIGEEPSSLLTPYIVAERPVAVF